MITFRSAIVYHFPFIINETDRFRWGLNHSRQVGGVLAVAILSSVTSVIKKAALMLSGRDRLVGLDVYAPIDATRGLLAQNEHLIPGARVVDRAACLVSQLCRGFGLGTFSPGSGSEILKSKSGAAYV